MNEQISPSHTQIDHYFEVLAPSLIDVPELAEVMKLTLNNRDHAFQVYNSNLAVVDYIVALDSEEIKTAKDARRELTEQGVVVSASQASVGDLLVAVGDKSVIPRIAHEAADSESEYFAPALNQLVERMKGGHDLKASGKTPSDGDEASGQVIWGHTLLLNPDALLNFTVCHYFERYVSQALIGAGISIGKQKDYFLNAMIDVVILDHLKEQNFGEIFDLWTKTKSAGGIGWIVPVMVEAFKAN